MKDMDDFVIFRPGVVLPAEFVEMDGIFPVIKMTGPWTTLGPNTETYMRAEFRGRQRGDHHGKLCKITLGLERWLELMGKIVYLDKIFWCSNWHGIRHRITGLVDWKTVETVRYKTDRREERVVFHWDLFFTHFEIYEVDGTKWKRK